MISSVSRNIEDSLKAEDKRCVDEPKIGDYWHDNSQPICLVIKVNQHTVEVDTNLISLSSSDMSLVTRAKKRAPASVVLRSDFLRFLTYPGTIQFPTCKRTGTQYV